MASLRAELLSADSSSSRLPTAQATIYSATLGGGSSSPGWRVARARRAGRELLTRLAAEGEDTEQA